MASYLYDSLQPSSQYYDRRSDLTEAEYKKRLETTTTVYIGNLHCNTSESALYELFTRAGQVKDIIMGVTREGIFAGFCFVVYQTHEEARVAVEYISQTKLYDRIIRVDWDYGFKEGRQYGRGIDGYQKRDQYRQTNDSGRHNIHSQWKEYQKQQQQTQSVEKSFNNQGNRGGYKSSEGGKGRNNSGGFNNYNRDNNNNNHNNHNRSNNHQEGEFSGPNKFKKSYNDFKNVQKRDRSRSNSAEANRKKRFNEEENED